MSKTLRPILILFFIAMVLQTTMGAQSLPPAIQWIPQDAVISLELSNSKALLDLFAGEKAVEFYYFSAGVSKAIVKSEIQGISRSCCLSGSDVGYGLANRPGETDQRGYYVRRMSRGYGDPYRFKKLARRRIGCPERSGVAQWRSRASFLTSAQAINRPSNAPCERDED